MAIPILVDGLPNPEILEDPRWSQSQQEAAVKVAKSDPAAAVVGIDAKLRPVVTCMVRKRRTTYALLRNGAPTPHAKITERWQSNGRRVAR